MNVLTVTGRLTRDPELKTVGQQQLCTFGVASQNTHKNQDGTYDANFYTVNFWGKQGETAAKFLRKGYKVAFSGDLVIRKYVDKNGAERQAIEVSGRSLDLIEEKHDESSAPSTYAAPAPSVPAGFTPVETDELPF